LQKDKNPLYEVERVAERSNGRGSLREPSEISPYLFMTSITDLCRELRKQQTPAEAILWQHLRNMDFSGKKFLRQHPVCVQSIFGKNLYYIPDFYCHELKLVIEADGPIHLFKKEYDKTGMRC
jgi:very-short-patch-repair endonuclease